MQIYVLHGGGDDYDDGDDDDDSVKSLKLLSPIRFIPIRLSKIWK